MTQFNKPSSDSNDTTDFGVTGVDIEQTLSQSFDPFSGLSVDTANFKNTKESLATSDEDGRIPLGLFYFEEDNIASDSFPNVIPDSRFRQVFKTNMVNNGSCKYIDEVFYTAEKLGDDNNPSNFPDATPVVFKPAGEWRYMFSQGVATLNYIYKSITTGLAEDEAVSGGNLSVKKGVVFDPPNSVNFLLNKQRNSSGDLISSNGKIVVVDNDDNILTSITVKKPNGTTLDIDLTAPEDIIGGGYVYDGVIVTSVGAIASIGISTRSPNVHVPKSWYYESSPMNFPIGEPLTYADDFPTAQDGNNSEKTYRHPVVFEKIEAYIMYVGNGTNENKFKIYPKWSPNQSFVSPPAPGVQNRQDIFNPYMEDDGRGYFYSDENGVVARGQNELVCVFWVEYREIDLDEVTSDLRKHWVYDNGLSMENAHAHNTQIGDNELSSYMTNVIRNESTRWRDNIFTPDPLQDFIIAKIESEGLEYSDEDNNSNYTGGGITFFEMYDSGYDMEHKSSFQQDVNHNDRVPARTQEQVGYGGYYNYIPLLTTEAIYALPISSQGSSMLNQVCNGNFINFSTAPPGQGGAGKKIPPYAFWITNEKAFSNGRCLVFHSRAEWNNSTITDFKNFIDGSDISTNYQLFEFMESNKKENQYRTLNQFQKIYDFYSNQLNPFATLKIKFKMFTEYSDSEEMPAVEMGLMGQHWGTYYDTSELQSDICKPSAYYNSTRYSSLSNNWEWSRLGGMERFVNNNTGEWQTFSFSITLDTAASTSDDKVKNLYFFVQAGNDFRGRVLLDDFEIYESGEFTPDVDVRKKKGPGDYGIGDLTKYYDKNIPEQFEAYNDTTAPLEAQFYFYPSFSTDTVFQKRTPIYQEFQQGLFYIYDIDWGDGSTKEFTSEPTKIDTTTALYHTYESSGIFEVTGYMFRTKPSLDGGINKEEPSGIIHNKKFRLTINVNEGLDEDFTYFGPNGFSFIPYNYVTPIIGGYSKESIYYKSITRQLGFISDNIKTNVQFKNKGDKLKTELALLKMDSSREDEFDILPNYRIQREDASGKIIYNDIVESTDLLGKSFGDTDITNIKFYTSPKSIWQMLGFEDADFEIGKPDTMRYWENIIPKDYSIYNREGVGDNYIENDSQQDWIDENPNLPGNNKYYYPVLPKYGADGKFINIRYGADGNVLPNTYPNNKIPFPLNGSITDEYDVDENLLININNETVENNVLNDNSGNKNLGFIFSDYKPNFDNKTLKPKKIKNFDRIKTTKTNGAF